MYPILIDSDAVDEIVEDLGELKLKDSKMNLFRHWIYNILGQMKQ